MTGRANRQPAGGLYETRRQDTAGMAVICRPARRSSGPAAPGRANLIHFAGTYEHAGVTLGWLGARIPAWLARWELETCAVACGLVAGGYAPAPRRADAALMPDHEAPAGRYPGYRGRLCRSPECPRERRRCL
jgi:hypothetical protein